MSDSVVAFEFDEPTAAALRNLVVTKLRGVGLSKAVAERLGAQWIRCEDFLLAQELTHFTDVVGNPPYMRWSKVPAVLRRRYESRLPSHAARGDLCLAFICRSVELLNPDDGRVAFLCSDRWLRCAYGSRARAELERTVRLAVHVGVDDANVFLGPRSVDAHAAVSVLERGTTGAPVISSASSVAELRRILVPSDAKSSTRSSAGFRGSQGAVLAPRDLADAFEQIAGSCLPVSNVGVEIRCGMALGCASVFVVEGPSDIEESRLVPFARSGDLLDSGKVAPSSRVINVWESSGELVELARYPKLSAHLETHRADLTKRACVKTPEVWYRTIDRLSLTRLAAPKLLVAGMAKSARVVMSPGGIQHSNALYGVTSSAWPLEALFALFRAGALDLFAAVLAPRFSGEVKRFDGNLLRQVRLPNWHALDNSLRKRLLDSDVESNVRDASLVFDVYKLTTKRLRKAVESALEK